MAWKATGAGEDYAYGKASQDGSAAANMQSWLMFDGTMVDSGAVNDLSRMTDAWEKGRIGIFGNALSYAGSYGRVTSESIGRDLNPLGRGDGRAYVAGALNLGRIAPRLPRGMAGVGTGNSVNNCNQKDPSPVAKDPQGSGSRCVDCCDPWNVDCGRTSGTNPNWENPCADVCDYENAPAGTDCRKRECECRKCTWEMWNSLGCSQPTRHEALCENCCCDGCPCSVGSGGGPAGTTGTGGCPGCGGPGRTGDWGPVDNGGGGGVPGYPPGWGIPGSGVTGPWRPLSGGGHGNFGTGGIMGINPYDPGRIGRGLANQRFYSQNYTSRLDYCCKGCVSAGACKPGECCKLEQAVRQAQKDYDDLNRDLFSMGLFFGGLALLVALSGVGAPIAVGFAVFGALFSALIYTMGLIGEYQNIKSSVSSTCLTCVRKCLAGLHVNFWDEVLAFLGFDALGFIPNPYPKLIPGFLWGALIGGASVYGGYYGPTDPWGDWLVPMPPPYAL